MSYNLENYEDVDTRLHRFWEQNVDGRVDTEIVHTQSDADGRLVQIIMKATIYKHREDINPIATGYAEERINTSPVNRTSMVENAETSCIGRALANGSYSAKGARASRQEMQKVERLDDAIKPGSGSAAAYRAGSNAPSEKQRKYAMTLLAGRDWLIEEFRTEKGIEGSMNKIQTGEFIEWLQAHPVTAEDINRKNEPLEVN